MAPLFAAVVLSPGGIISWLVVGLLAGFLAGNVMKGSGYGIVADIIVGLIGSFLGGLVVGFFVDGFAGFWGSIVVAFIGACLLIAIVRAISGRRAL
jgi:uncharacterized membrane protein YeaQ/YmgE (transglycosylase-associated protein family)